MDFLKRTRQISPKAAWIHAESGGTKIRPIFLYKFSQSLQTKNFEYFQDAINVGERVMRTIASVYYLLEPLNPAMSAIYWNQWMIPLKLMEFHLIISNDTIGINGPILPLVALVPLVS